jgi:hypothetical protein
MQKRLTKTIASCATNINSWGGLMRMANESITMFLKTFIIIPFTEMSHAGNAIPISKKSLMIL